MKKSFLLMLSFTILLTFIACNTSTSKSSTQQSTSSTTTLNTPHTHILSSDTCSLCGKSKLMIVSNLIQQEGAWQTELSSYAIIEQSYSNGADVAFIICVKNNQLVVGATLSSGSTKDNFALLIPLTNNSTSATWSRTFQYNSTTQHTAAGSFPLSNYSYQAYQSYLPCTSDNVPAALRSSFLENSASYASSCIRFLEICLTDSDYYASYGITMQFLGFFASI